MKSEPPETISLSFVEVITNGMGSLLILFLLMTVVRENVNLGAPETPDVGAIGPPNPNAGGVDQASLKDPFVVLVTAGGRGGLFAEGRTGAWVVPEWGRRRRPSAAPCRKPLFGEFGGAAAVTPLPSQRPRLLSLRGDPS